MCSKTKPRLAWVDAGKGLSILLVVLYHATEWMDSAGYEITSLTYVNKLLTDLRMPIFFFLSGLFASKWIMGSWRALIDNKILLFAWVYLLWSFLVIPTKWLAMAFLSDKIQDDFLLRQLIATATIPLRASGSIWFIWALLLFFLIAKITSSIPMWTQVAIAAALSLGVRTVPSESMEKFVDLTGLGYRGALLYYIFFLLGAFFRERTQNAVKVLSIPASVAIFVAWAGTWVVLDIYGLNDFALVSFAMSFGGVVAGVSLAVLLHRLPALCWLGQHTLPVYLTHSSLLILILCGVQLVPTEFNETAATLVAVGATAIAIIVGARLHSVRRLKVLFEPPRFIKQITTSNI